jgi:Phosphodiester glycosidase/SPOR domain
MRSTRHLTFLVVGVVGALSLALAALPAPTGAAEAGPSLGLGADGLDETRTTERLQPGVTMTTIVRGHPDPKASWTIEIAVPEDGSPDPDAPAKAIVDRPSAEQTAQRIGEAGYAARVEPVRTARVADYGGRLGYRVRIGRYAAKEEADAALARIREQTGLSGSSVFTGWDPQADSTGPWRIRVLRVDPRSFEGNLVGSYGPDLERREKTSELAALRAATAAVNAGFFVLDPAAGAPGDPAGAGVYGGALLSESVDGRPVLTFGADGRRAGVRRVHWTGTARRGTESLRLDGINRVPGLVRNCGGTGDSPTDRPLHDVTCTDGDEVVAFSGEYAARTPEGPGVEVALDARGVVVDVRSSRGGVVPPGGRTLQATGAQEARLRALAPLGRRVRVSTSLIGPGGRALPTSAATYVLNGGPELVDGGRPHATPRADGMVHPGDPSFYYGWAHKRNPRTLAGVDASGRVLLVTVDGRSTASMGLSVAESAALADDLGMREAVNLDGGGSTTMVARGQVVNQPSDPTGERPVGDAVLVLPG